VEQRGNYPLGLDATLDSVPTIYDRESKSHQTLTRLMALFEFPIRVVEPLAEQGVSSKEKD
jgi:hypothetical protein